MNRKLQPIKDTWKKKAMSLCSDGWSDRQRRPLINIMAASVGGAMFLKAVDASGNINDANYAAGGIIEGIYPHIFWTQCVLHCLNLALKSICEPSENSPQFAKCKWIADLVSSVQNIRNSIVNHGMVLSIFNTYSELGLLKITETRFALSIIMAKRMREVKDALEKMVMDPSWRMLADTDAPVLHLIYDIWDTMIEKVKYRIFGHENQDLLTGQSNFFDIIHNILETRWKKSNNPLHCMAHSLFPKYYIEAWIGGGSDGVPRLSPHEDQEVSLNRSKCFKRLFCNQDDLRKVYIEYGAFSSGFSYFNEPHVINAKLFEEPISWWANHSALTPMLQALAFELLSQPASSSCCERNWSTYSLLQSIKRNRLTTSRAEDLVFVYCNFRLLSRKKKEYKEGSTKYWVLCGDRFDTDDNTFGELVELSINEPELELMTFDEEFEKSTTLGTELTKFQQGMMD
ncbi:uncharacterized protein LOC132316546 [Cornus florida]|uniref:uncharacterized protein LOC132316546 n=1 Tax=Cornus florida TaxID=4283 RepID=UPI002897DAF6|nr:uncharacterized protein LOC132316546 [Cornus florida]